MTLYLIELGSKLEKKEIKRKVCSLYNSFYVKSNLTVQSNMKSSLGNSFLCYFKPYNLCLIYNMPNISDVRFVNWLLFYSCPQTHGQIFIIYEEQRKQDEYNKENHNGWFYRLHLHLTCTLPAPYLHLTCTLPAHYLHPTYTSPTPYLHLTCTLPAPYLHITCTLPTPHLHLTCTLPAPYLHLTCTLPTPAPHLTCTLPAPYLHPTCHHL